MLLSFTDLGEVMEEAIFNNLGIDAVIVSVLELDTGKFIFILMVQKFLISLASEVMQGVTSNKTVD